MTKHPIFYQENQDNHSDNIYYFGYFEKSLKQ